MKLRSEIALYILEIAVLLLSGSFGRFPETEDIARRLQNHTYLHDLHGHEVRAIIQLDEERFRLQNRQILKGMVIDHVLSPHSDLMRDTRGRYYVNTNIKPRLIWTRFEIIGNNLVRVDNSHARTIAFDVLSRGLNGAVNDYVKPAFFDLQRLANDYAGHWVGGIQDRAGHMQSGIFYGESIEDDDVIGTTYRRGTKNQVGFETDYFGNGSTKVRITREGSVQVYGDVAENAYLQFVTDELLPYMIQPPRTRHRRTS